MFRALAALFAFALLAAGGEAPKGLPLVFQDDFEKGAGRWEPTDPKGWKVIGTDRAHGFFAEWVENAVGMAADGNRWAEVSGALDIAFSLGNLARHGLLPADDPLRREAAGFAKTHGVSSLDSLAALYRDLPDPVTARGCEDILATLLKTVVDELRKGTK